MDIEQETDRRPDFASPADREAWRARRDPFYDLAPVGYCALSPGGLILESNLTAATLLGEERSALVKRPLARYIHPDDQELFALQRKRALKTGDGYECDLRMTRKDGTLFWAHLAGTSGTSGDSCAQAPGRKAGDGRLSLLVMSDITERKRAEEEKVRMESRNVEALGLLAGGIAHDFNNLLTAIIGNATLGAMKVGPQGEVAPLFQAIETAAARAAYLTRQLLAYAGKGRFTVHEMDLNASAAETVRHGSSTAPQDVTLQFEPADRLPFVRADPDQLFLVLMNLVTNAVEACADRAGGLVTVRTRAEGVDRVALKYGNWPLPVPPGRFATVEVTDSGMGMAPEVLARALEPFFTTKFLGRGLGLAAVAGILRSHGGGLRVQSVPALGSSFKIYLPAMQGPRSAQALETGADWRGTGRLLIIDDDPEARDGARHLAERLGFAVTGSPLAAAVELVRHHPGAFALVVLGLGRSRSEGSRTLARLRKIDGQVPVILGSGTDLENPEAHFQAFQGILRKPYRLAEFQSLLRRTLARQEPV